jgi:D-serine dehydratase
MDLIQKIDASISSLNDPENNVFDFDKELELLNELKPLIEKFSNDQIVSSYNINNNIDINNNNILQDEIGRLEQFQNFIIKEITDKMKILEYPLKQIFSISKLNDFNSIINIRDKIFKEFDSKFCISRIIPEFSEENSNPFLMFKL